MITVTTYHRVIKITNMWNYFNIRRHILFRHRVCTVVVCLPAIKSASAFGKLKYFVIDACRHFSRGTCTNYAHDRLCEPRNNEDLNGAVLQLRGSITLIDSASGVSVITVRTFISHFASIAKPFITSQHITRKSLKKSVNANIALNNFLDEFLTVVGEKAQSFCCTTVGLCQLYSLLTSVVFCSTKNYNVIAVSCFECWPESTIVKFRLLQRSVIFSVWTCRLETLRTAYRNRLVTV